MGATWKEIKQLIQQYCTNATLNIEKGALLNNYKLKIDVNGYFEASYRYEKAHVGGQTQMIFDQDLIFKIITIQEVVNALQPVLRMQISYLAKELEQCRKVCKETLASAEKVVEV